MQKEYIITGMTCSGCVNKVKKSLETVNGVLEANVKLENPQGTLKLKNPIPLTVLQNAIGHYEIKEVKNSPVIREETEEKPTSFIATYKPLLLIVAFIAGVSLLVQYPFTTFSGMLWMRHFMAGFFLVFSFFKLLNIEGFASSYQMYDLVAEQWRPWGYIYPFIELGLGILYLVNLAPVVTNIITLVVLGVSSIGVIKSNLDKRKIKCACLGDVFNLPMSTVTIVEDLTMVAMAGWMLLSM